MTGLHLSQYRIDAELGRGGMGIVYRATDTKLDRTVALKVLPPHALASEDDRARFYREARAAAKLNHPHIATIHQIDEAVPSDAPHGTEPRPFIAMEFVDGESLAERIAQGPLRLDEAVRIARQVAEALGAAHEAGIVHRDVKSGNVMLTAKGEVKVLDFGLAKTAASTQLTKQGSTLGTIAYMSPEQARGEEVDRRTDLWALGVVLYEMIAGRLPFQADYEQATLYAILNEDPEPLTALRTGVPMGLEWIVTKLLAKQVSDRYQNASDLIVDLRTVDLTSQTLSRTTRTSVAAVPVSTAAPRSRNPVRMAVVAAVGVVFLAIGMWVGLRIGADNDSLPTPPRRFEVLTLESGRRSQWSGWPADEALLNRDGSEIVLRRDGSLWVRSMTSLRLEKLPGTEGAIGSAGSLADLRFITFATEKAIRRLDRQTGTVQDVAPLPDDREFAVGAVDGVYVTTGSRIRGPLTSSGSLTVRTDSIPGLTAFNKLPGDSGFLVAATDSTSDRLLLHVSDRGMHELLRLPSRSRIESIDHDSDGMILMTIYTEEGNRSAIWVMQFDPETDAVLREPSVLINDAAAPSVSSDGALLYSTSVPADSTELVLVDRATADMRRIGTPLAFMTAPSVSPDGRRVVVAASVSGTQDTWLFDLDRNTQGRFTQGIQNTWLAGWSPDGSVIAVQSRLREDRYSGDIYVQATSGLAEPRLVKGGPDNDWYPAITPDGLSVLYSHNTLTDSETRFEVAPIDGSSPPRVVLDPPYALGAPSFSRDGRWLVFNASRDGVWNTFVAPWPALDAVYQVSSGGGALPRWVGDEIFFVVPDGDVWAVPVEEGMIPSFGTPRLALSAEAVGGDLAPFNTINFAVMPGGRQFVVTRPVGDPAPTHVIYVENWKSLLDRNPTTP